MKLVLLLLSLASPLLAATWPLDDAAETMIVRGSAKTAAGASGQSLVLDGESLIELKDSAQLGSGAFTVSLWFNPYDLAGGQQILAGKNRYSLDQRQWSLSIEPDGSLKAYLQQGGWRTISCEEPVKAGAWHFVTLAVGADKAVLFLNGKTVGETTLKTPIAATEAPITLGGIRDAERVRQAFHGALDDFSYQPGFLSAEEIEASYRPVLTTHEIPQLAAGLPLWDAAHPMPKAAELPQAAGAEFHVIKNQRPDTDQCRFTLGVGLAWHKGRLYASYGFNRGEENTPTEEAHVKVSDDGGKTWGPAQVMDAGEGDLAVSHGVFLSQGGRLWAFMGAFYAHEKLYHRVHARAYLLDENTGAWESRGSIVDGGFWPMQEPLKMADGNWIMAGFRIGGQFGEAGNLPAVAISQGDDFTKWDLVVIPAAPGLGNIWGESTVIVEDKRILNISRYGKKALALLSVSEDQGRTWTPTRRSNLPMATSKPYAGTLSTGQRYLVCTTTADTGGARSPLTIAVSKPGESLFSQVFLIRHSVSEKTPGISAPKADFSYPYAVEHEGKLYIGYTHKSHAANELAVIPVSSLQEPEPVAIWKGSAIPKVAELPALQDARFSVIKPYEFTKDGYRFLHGVALCFHKGRLYASFGHNKGGENTDTEEARFCVSEDDGKTWGEVRTMDAGEGPVGVSHGAFLSHKGTLWAFHGAYTGTMKGVHTRAYVLDETTQQWQSKGTVIEQGFWPMQEPQKMEDGNWIMAGLKVGAGDPAVVAISHGEDFTRWEVVPIPQAKDLKKMWGESTVIVEGKRVTNISRYGAEARALIATSEDYGRTWGEMRPGNLPMATSKPIAGTLSTGQRYLVCTTTADSGKRRSPLTIAVSEPGETLFSKVFVIRHALFPEGPGESHQGAALSYPYAVEHDGKLYVGYSNSGDKSTRVGTGRELWNNNSAELAVIPVASLSVTAEASPVATLESRGLPRILFNNDSDDLKWPAYPEHHANGLWVPAGEYLPLPTINSLDDALAPRIGPLAKTKTQGLSYCGNFGLPIWELKRDHIAALGDDPLQPILQFWKRDGRTFFFSMRMNDVHHGWFNWAHLWDDFRRTHRDLFLKPPTDKEWEAEFLPWFEGKTSKRPAISTSSVAFDYSRAEVRTYYLETLREACRRYDLDGVELDWLRYPNLFRERDVDVAVMTAFVRDARAVLDEAAKRRGHPLRLLARVPVTPEQALSVGLDVEAWLKAGWLDAVIAGPGTSFSSCPLERWVDLAHRHGVPVYGSMERQNRNNVPRYGSPETLRAAIATLWEKGADGLYFFNFYIRDEMPLLDEFADRAVLARLPKEYFLESGGDKDLTKSGGPLPLALKPVTPATVHLVIADDPAKAREASLEIVFKAAGEFEPPLTTLNGQPLQELKSTSAKEGFTLTLSSAALKQALKHGTNAFTFTSPATVTLTSLSVRVVP